jgi:hypothetical protein
MRFAHVEMVAQPRTSCSHLASISSANFDEWACLRPSASSCVPSSSRAPARETQVRVARECALARSQTPTHKARLVLAEREPIVRELRGHGNLDMPRLRIHRLQPVRRLCTLVLQAACRVASDPIAQLMSGTSEATFCNTLKRAVTTWRCRGATCRSGASLCANFKLKQAGRRTTPMECLPSGGSYRWARLTQVLPMRRLP